MPCSGCAVIRNPSRRKRIDRSRCCGCRTRDFSATEIQSSSCICVPTATSPCTRQRDHSTRDFPLGKDEHKPSMRARHGAFHVLTVFLYLCGLSGKGTGPEPVSLSPGTSENCTRLTCELSLTDYPQERWGPSPHT